MKSFLLGLLGSIVGLIAAALAYSQYGDYIAESEISGWIAQNEAVQSAIARRAREHGSLVGVGREVVLPDIAYAPPDFYRVTDDGVILMRGGDDGQFVALVPTLANGEVTWQCIGGSKDSVNMWCEDPRKQSRPTPGL